MVGDLIFTTSDTKPYVSVVTLFTEDNAKFSKLLSEGFKRSVYWNKYKMVPNRAYDANAPIRELLDASYQGLKRLFILAYGDAGGANRVTADSHTRYFLPRVKIKNYNIDIDRINFDDQPINDSIKQYSKVRKVSAGQGDDCATGCFLNFACFEKNYRLIGADLSKQKALDAESRAIQQIIFTGNANAAAIIYYILKQSKETNSQTIKRNNFTIF